MFSCHGDRMIGWLNVVCTIVPELFVNVPVCVAMTLCICMIGGCGGAISDSGRGGGCSSLLWRQHQTQTEGSGGRSEGSCIIIILPRFLHVLLRTCMFTPWSLCPSLPPSLSPSHLGHLCWICPVWSHKPLPCGTCIWCTDCYPGTQVHHLCWLQCCSPYPLGCGRGPDHGNSPPIFLKVGSSLPCSIHSSLSLCIATDSIDWQKNWQEDHTETKVHMHEQSINHVSLKNAHTHLWWKLLYFRFVKQDQVVIARLQTAGIICLETFQAFPQMARFTLRDEGIFVCVCVCVHMHLHMCSSGRGAHVGVLPLQQNNYCFNHMLFVFFCCCCFFSGKTIAIGKVLKLVE